jgi:plastocyanin
MRIVGIVGIVGMGCGPEGAAYRDQQGQMFMPDTLLVRTGQPVHFRSSEDVLHNVRMIRSDNPASSTASAPT